VRDADLGQLAEERRAGRRVELAPPRRRRLRASGIVGVDMLAAELDTEIRLYGLHHFGRGVEGRQASDDKCFDLIREGGHGFVVL